MYYRGEDTRQEEPPIASQSSPLSDMASSGIPDLTTPKGVEIFLSTTTPQFSVSRVDVLKGGSANFTYRAHLLETFSEGEEVEEVKSVIVKHAELFVALAKEVRFDVRRCVSIQLLFRSDTGPKLLQISGLSNSLTRDIPSDSSLNKQHCPA